MGNTNKIFAVDQVKQQSIVNHVCVIDLFASHRLMSFQAGGKSHTLCGSPRTSLDVLYRDAKKMTDEDRREWVRCPACLSELMGNAR